MPMSRVRMVLVCLAVAAPACFGQHPIPESERWVTITNPGNEPFPADFGGGLVIPLGRVDYEYQISRTEVTATEWLEFVKAQAPFLNPFEAIGIDFTTQYIRWSPATGEYTVRPGFENRPIENTWRYGARMVNWLHNDKAMTAEAFENGAYDVSTFGTNPDGTVTDQIAHSPDARYWIPTWDEWVKAAHFDPDRYGPNMPGYWMYSHSSDVAPIQGPPGVGETNGGIGPFLNVASYPSVQSPWGLWDTLGGIGEWTETPWSAHPNDPLPAFRITEGSIWNELGIEADRINYALIAPPSSVWAGFRIARAIPNPSGALVLLGAVFPFTRRRRPAHDASIVHSRFGDPVPRDTHLANSV
jgi:formylglycine-generating enzyme required for sulfatase activity